MKYFALLVLAGVALATSTDRVCPKLRNTLKNHPKANVFVDFVGSNSPVLNSFDGRVFATRGERLTNLKASLVKHAQTSQRHVTDFLKSKSVPFKSFWISNQVYITNANLELVNELASIQEVQEIYEEHIVHLDEPIRGKQRSRPTPLAEWGIERVRAEAAWAVTNGSGVVISNIDTGVHYTHETLANNYRSDHGWFDPYQGTQMPNDQNGHGTHTMGTKVGTHGIGVAPGAEWIACKGCATSSCTQPALTACGEWVVCPTNWDGSDEDCSLAPALVSNSWGSSGGQTWFEPITEAWIEGGLVPIFAIGNSGPSCRSAGSPGDLRRVIGVGATNIDNELAYFSGVGPSAANRMKPELSAPGEDVRSAVPGAGNNQYDEYSGTSMACPHVAGVTALLLAVDPDQSFGEVRQALLEGCDQETTSQNGNCGGARDDEFPNNHFGWGIINAEKVVTAAVAKKAKKH